MNLVVHLLVDSLYQTLHCLYFFYTAVYYEMYICTPHTTSSGYIYLLDSSLFASYIEMTYVHICNMCNTVWILHHSSSLSGEQFCFSVFSKLRKATLNSAKV